MIYRLLISLYEIEIYRLASPRAFWILSTTVMNKSLRPLCKSDDFQHLTCNCIRHILLLRYKFVFFVVLHLVPILILCTFSARFLCYLLIFLMLDMDKKKSPSEVQKTQIVALPGRNQSKRQISAQMRCIKTAMAKYQQDGSSADSTRMEDCMSPPHEKIT